MVAILAHEVDHHMRFHTVTPGRDHEFELEADYQAGFILRPMGATLEQTQICGQAHQDGKPRQQLPRPSTWYTARALPSGHRNALIAISLAATVC